MLSIQWEEEAQVTDDASSLPLTDRFLNHFDEDLKILSIGHRASTDKQKAGPNLADAAKRHR
jgi:hypothetical protein